MKDALGAGNESGQVMKPKRGLAFASRRANGNSQEDGGDEDIGVPSMPDCGGHSPDQRSGRLTACWRSRHQNTTIATGRRTTATVTHRAATCTTSTTRNNSSPTRYPTVTTMKHQISAPSTFHPKKRQKGIPAAPAIGPAIKRTPAMKRAMNTALLPWV